MGLSGQRHSPAALLPGKETRYRFCSRQGGPQWRPGRVRKISPPPAFDPRTAHPVASRYTDGAISTHVENVNLIWIKLLEICPTLSNKTPEIWPSTSLKADMGMQTKIQSLSSWYSLPPPFFYYQLYGPKDSLITPKTKMTSVKTIMKFIVLRMAVTGFLTFRRRNFLLNFSTPCI